MAFVELTPARKAGDPPRFTINPLALWTQSDLEDYAASRLPARPPSRKAAESEKTPLKTLQR